MQKVWREIGLDPRERIEAFWAGECPDQIPYTMYWNGWRRHKDEGDWEPLFQAGMRYTRGVATAASRTHNVERRHVSMEQDGRTILREIMHTPVGDIYRDSADGWVQKYWLETADDYRVMLYIVNHTEIYPDYEAYHRIEAESAGRGIIHVSLGARSPLQNILVDYVGLENFALHLFDMQSEIEELYDALLCRLRQRAEIVAAGPGRYVSMLENFTADTMGPARYARYHMPVYQELFPLLHSAGKVVGTHYDGRLAACQDQIAQTPIDIIESLTPPPEGDMSLAMARAKWPNKLFWSNINISLYQLPAQKLRAAVLDAVQQAAPDGRGLAFEISEDMPDNWQEALPVVMAALAETKRQ